MKILGKAILENMRKAKEKKSTVGEIKEKLQNAIRDHMRQIKSKQ